MNNLDKFDHMIRKVRERIELDQLYNIWEGDLFVREYIARFEDLTRDVKERHPRP